MTDAPQPDALAAALRALTWTMRRVAPTRAGVVPIPTSELAILKEALAAPGSTINELSNAVGVQRSNASSAIRALILRGLVTRETSSQDRRRALIVPTELAEAEARAIGDAWSVEVAEALEELDAEDVRALRAATAALNNLEQVIKRRRVDQRSR